MSFLEFIRHVVKQIVESVEYMLLSVTLLRGKRHVRAVEPNEVRPKKILIVQMNSIGDVLMMTPALRALKRCFGDSTIDVLVQPFAADLLREDPDINGVYSCGWAFWRGRFTQPAAFNRSARTVKALKSARYDLCVHFGRNFETVVNALLAEAAVTVGFRQTVKRGIFRRNAEDLYDIAVDTDEKHIARQALQLVKFLGCEGAAEKEELFISVEKTKGTEAFLRENGLGEGDFAVMHPGAKWPPKRWPKGSFARLVKLIFDEKGMKTVLIGSASDKELLRKIKEESGIPDTVIAGDLDLAAAAAVIRKACVFVGNDSGPAHMAAALGTDTVVLFGPTDPEACRPLGGGVKIFHYKVPCWPCMMYYRRDRCEAGSNVCLQNISAGDVYETVGRIIERKGHGG